MAVLEYVFFFFTIHMGKIRNWNANVIYLPYFLFVLTACKLERGSAECFAENTGAAL